MKTNSMNGLDDQEIAAGEIWLLIDTLNFGGIETHVRELANGLNTFKQPVRVVVLKKYARPQLLQQSLQQLGLPCTFLSELLPEPVASGKTILTQLYLSVRQHRPHILHAHGYKASICSRVIKLLTGVRQISTYHAGETPRGKVWFYDWLDRYTSFFSTQAISVSSAIAAKLPVKSITMNNFITQPPPSERKGKQIAFIGRLSREKAPERFVKLARQFPMEDFHLYGDGPLFDEITQSAPPNLSLHGHVSDMQSHWLEIDLVVIPSRFEGLPMVSLEAMGRGIPVIATNVGALDTLIEHGVNGWLANSAQELLLLFANWQQMTPNERHQIGRAARQTIHAHYTDQAVIPQLIALYQHS
ncbi:glycosyltransferase family 4 protein [Vibrio fluvialis]